MLQVLEHLCDKDRLAELGLFSLEQKRPLGRLQCDLAALQSTSLETLGEMF